MSFSTGVYWICPPPLYGICPSLLGYRGCVLLYCRGYVLLYWGVEDMSSYNVMYGICPALLWCMGYVIIYCHIVDMSLYTVVYGVCPLPLYVLLRYRGYILLYFGVGNGKSIIARTSAVNWIIPGGDDVMSTLDLSRRHVSRVSWYPGNVCRIDGSTMVVIYLNRYTDVGFST